MMLSVALGLQAHRIGFMIACRPGVASPTFFAQQLNTVSQLLGGRVSVNVVAGHTPRELGYYGCFLGHDERLDQADEFLEVCRAIWARGSDSAGVSLHGHYYDIENACPGTAFAAEGVGPEVYLGGNSPRAAAVAARHATCLFRIAEPPDAFRTQVEPVLAAGKEVGLLVALIGGRTRAEAVDRAEAMIARLNPKARDSHHDIERGTDSVAFRSTYELARRNGSGWLTDTLWAGAVPYLGAPSIALVGSAADLAGAILDYRREGVSQFLFLGWPDAEEMTFFGREVLPLIRAQELAEGNTSGRGSEGVVRCP
jgi:alkanesulfonate monooxygenase